MHDSRAQSSTLAATAPRSERNDAPPAAARPQWRQPRLVDHGDVRELTLGVTSGNFESGAPGTFHP